MVGYAPAADNLSGLRESSQRPYKPLSRTAELGFSGWKNSHWPIMHHLATMVLAHDGRSSQSIRGCTAAWTGSPRQPDNLLTARQSFDGRIISGRPDKLWTAGQARVDGEAVTACQAMNSQSSHQEFNDRSVIDHMYPIYGRSASRRRCSG